MLRASSSMLEEYCGICNRSWRISFCKSRIWLAYADSRLTSIALITMGVVAATLPPPIGKKPRPRPGPPTRTTTLLVFWFTGLPPAAFFLRPPLALPFFREGGMSKDNNVISR